MADSQAAVILFDVDCFYCQSEELRNPAALKGRPVGIQQKQIIVTCNYEARARGVQKLQLIAHALQSCPELRIVNGEDLTPYRAAAKLIRAVLNRYGPIEYAGLDEVYVDVSKLANQRLAASGGAAIDGVQGWLYDPSDRISAPNAHRPGDLEVNAAVGGARSSDARPCDARLCVASHIAAEARAAVFAELGFTISAGIAVNKMLCKISAGFHKPNDQTTIRLEDATACLSSLAVRALPSIGSVKERALEQLGIHTVGDIRSKSLAELKSAVGDRLGTWLWDAAVGIDHRPVVESGPPKQISVEDSFKAGALATAVQVLSSLVPDLRARLVEDAADHGRHAKTLTVSWRIYSQRSSASCPMPATSPSSSPDAWEAATMRAAEGVLRRAVPAAQANALSLVNIAATAFAEGNGGGATGPSIAELFSRASAAPGNSKESSPASKSDPRPQHTAGQEDGAATPVPATKAPHSGHQDIRSLFLKQASTAAPSYDGSSYCVACSMAVEPHEHADYHLALCLQRAPDREPAVKKAKKGGPLDALFTR